MGDTQIKVGSYIFTFQPSDIDSVEEVIGADIQNIKIASSAPAQALNYDYNGTEKTIVITGRLHTADTTRVAGYSVTTKIAQKQWLESLINGAQGDIELEDDYAGQTAYTKAGATPPYLTTFTSTFAKAGNIRFRRDNGKPNEIPFTISLFVGQG